MRCISIILGAVTLIVASGLAAERAGQYGGPTTTTEPAPLLIPVIPHAGEAVRGARGSLWGGFVYFYNPGPFYIPTPQGPLNCGMFCLDPGVTIQLFPQRLGADRGSLFPAYGVYEARLEEYSEPGQPVGVEIPVVWPSEYIADETTLVVHA